MATIVRLPESTYKRIAAGEVIVNPAAAVKELVENALDAGASAITVETVEGGRDLIRVTDNGSGMSPEDLALATEKHATSKIASFDEVYALQTLGFRGEALSSIAEVAHLTISTREKGSPQGAELQVAGGGEPVIREAGLPEGTTVRVDDLFYNIPARRKFLKSAAREGAAVTDVVKRLILSRPDVAFKYIRNHHVAYQTPGGAALRQVAAIIYGPDALRNMVDVSYEGRHARVTGLVSKPTYVFKGTQRLEFFLNGRSVVSKSLQDAVRQGYQGSILHGHHPACVLNIETDPAAIDINIHPAKLSALLFQEEDVVRDVATAVSEAALKNIAPPTVAPSSVREEPAPVQEQIQYDRPAPTPNFWMTVPRGTPLSDAISGVRSAPEEADGEAAPPPVPAAADAADEYEAEPFSPIPEAPEPEPESDVPDLRTLTDYRIIGTAFSTYILCEAADAIYLIDQHAAQERLTYESILAWTEADEKYGQLLLIPVVRTFSAAEYDLLLEHREMLSALGLDFEPFGSLTLRFLSFPVQVASADTERFLDALLEELRTYGSDAVVARDRIITQACRHSVKAGTDLTEREVARLVHEIVTAETIPHCPHGRPIAVVLKRSDLEKGFKRRV